MRIVTYFDTETTGLVKYKLPHGHSEQPHLVQLAMIMVDIDTWNPIMKLSTLVAAAVESEPKALEAHGITKKMTDEYGIQPKTAAAFVRHFAGRSEMMVAHNKAFDMKLLQVEQARHGSGEDPFGNKEVFCTMAAMKPIMEMPPTEKSVKAGFGNTFKPPKLAEAIMYLFGEELKGAHDALVDTEACMRIHRWLIQEGKV